MKYLEKYSRSIFNLMAKFALNRYQGKTIEQVLKRSLMLLDYQIIDEIRSRTASFQESDGGFKDKGGESDLYYSLFGMYVAECLEDEHCIDGLRGYLKKYLLANNPEGVYLFSAAILTSKLGISGYNLLEKISHDIQQLDINKPGYTLFLGALAYYYNNDFASITRLMKGYKGFDHLHEIPLPVLASNTVIQKISGHDTAGLQDEFMTFYQGNGSFGAMKKSPAGDMLSTAVALYTLAFINADLRNIRPDCLNYINSLYHEGSFRATEIDMSTDIEYTFYGLLALGALS